MSQYETNIGYHLAWQYWSYYIDVVNRDNSNFVRCFKIPEGEDSGGESSSTEEKQGCSVVISYGD
jgi:hypothetical protein